MMQYRQWSFLNNAKWRSLLDVAKRMWNDISRCEKSNDPSWMKRKIKWSPQMGRRKKMATLRNRKKVKWPDKTNGLNVKQNDCSWMKKKSNDRSWMMRKRKLKLLDDAKSLIIALGWCEITKWSPMNDK